MEHIPAVLSLGNAYPQSLCPAGNSSNAQTEDLKGLLKSGRDVHNCILKLVKLSKGIVGACPNPIRDQSSMYHTANQMRGT